MKYQLLIFVLFFVIAISCSEKTIIEHPQNTKSGARSSIVQPSFNLSGYATQGGGTTGGAGGITVYANNYADLKLHLESAEPKIVIASGTIYNGPKGGIIFIASNKTLLGTGNSTLLNGVGLAITNASNVIVRNVKCTMTGITDRTDPAVYDPDGDEGLAQIIVNDGDCMRINGTSSRVWIDHCEMYNVSPSIQKNKDLYDGLLDITQSTTHITVSWNYFHDHHKVHLVGSDDVTVFDRRITFHHNYYKNVVSRLPMYRFGKGHIYNNYYTQVSGSAIDCRSGTCQKIERNVFETVRNPVVRTGTTLGSYQLNGNRYSGITGTAFPTQSNCSHTPPYSFVLDDINIVKSECMNKSGVGKI